MTDPGSQIRPHRTRALPKWLLLSVVVLAAAFVAVWRFVVNTRSGQILDEVALLASTVGHETIAPRIDPLLHAIPIVSLVTAIVVLGYLVRTRRYGLMLVSIAILVGANLTTQAFKLFAGRPDFGIGDDHLGSANTLPSGHTTLAASITVVVVLAMPLRTRGVGGFVGTGVCALIGIATLSADWHRPSDIVAALLLVAAWTAVSSGVVIGLGGRHRSGAPTGNPHPVATTVLGAAGVALLTAGAIALTIIDHAAQYAPDAELTNDASGSASIIHAAAHTGLSHGQLFMAYAGSAAAIAGSAALMMALTLASAHLLAPRSRSTSTAECMSSVA